MSGGGIIAADGGGEDRLMGHQEHEQIYLSLSRKELQGLCRQHGLPANRSNIDLARSLESLFRRSNFSPSQSEEAFDVLPFSEPRPKDQSKSSRETDKGFGREYITRKNSSKAGTYRRIACLKESVGQDKRDSQTANHWENDNQVNNQTSDKALNRVTKTVIACFASDGTTEDVGCSTSGAGTSGLHLFASDVQDNVACHSLGLQGYQQFNRNGCDKISELKNNHCSVQSSVVTSSRMHSLPLAPSRMKKFGECFPGRGFISPDVISSAVPPAFQFFVESEDGVDLFVDLSSTPSEWVKSLKDEVFISQESYNRKSLALCHEIRCLGDANKKLKMPSTEIIGTGLQRKGSDGSTGCVNSSLSSVSEICNSVSHPMNYDTPRSSVLTSNRSPVEPSGRLDEVSQVVSSSCSAHANTKSFMVIDMLSCPGDVEALPPNSAGYSMMLEKANGSPHNCSPSKSSCNSQVNLQADRQQKFDQVQHLTLEAGSICSQNIEEGFLGHISESASEKSSFSFSERCEISRTLDTCSHENHSICQSSLVSSSREMKLLEVADHDRAKSTAYEAPTQQKLACPVNSTELDEGELTKHIHYQHVCTNPGNPVLVVQASTSNKELEACLSLKEKNSQSPRSTKLPARNCKRYNISELHEDFQSKRQLANGENQIGATMKLRSTKTHLKESNSDTLVLPRRSIRLMSKKTVNRIPTTQMTGPRARANEEQEKP